MIYVNIKNPPEYTEQIPKWDKVTPADGEAMGLVIEQLANNAAYNKAQLERQEHVVTVTLTAAGWEAVGDTGLYRQSVLVPGAVEGMELTVVSALADQADMNTRKAYKKAFGIVAGGTGTLENGTAVFIVDKKPVTDVVIGLRGV